MVVDLLRATQRVVVGSLFVGHGTQKLFGWFGGSGLRGTTEEFRELGLTPAEHNALLAGASQLTGGVLLMAGLAHPLACAMVGATALNAIPVCAPNGPWARSGGWEYPLVLATALPLMAAQGPGAASLDRRRGRERRGVLPAVASLAGAAAAGVVVQLAARRTR